MGWAFRNAGTVGTSFNAPCTPGTPATIVAGDLLLIASTELLGADTQPTVSGWNNISLNTNWSTGCAVYAKIAAGSDSMPTIPSWGNQFQAAACVVYSGGPASLTGLVDSSSRDKSYNSTSILSFNSTTTPTNNNSLVVAVSFKNTLGNSTPVLTETGGLVGFNRRITQWPNASRPTIVIDDSVQTSATAITGPPAMSQNFTEASTQTGHSVILVFNPVLLDPPGMQML